MKNNLQTKPQIQQEDKNRSAAIMLAIEISSNFKLYSYRIISHIDFTNRTIELLQVFDQSYTKPKTNPEPNNQLDLVDEINKTK